MSLRSLSIARRAGLGFALIALLVAILGFFALSNMASIRESAVQVERGLVPKMRLVSDIREIMLRIRTISLRMALDPNPASIPQYRSQMDTRSQDLSKRLADLDAVIDSPKSARCMSSSRSRYANTSRAWPGRLRWPTSSRALNSTSCCWWT